MSRFLRFGLFGVLALSLCLLSSSVTRSSDDDDDKEDIAKAKKLADPLKKLVEAEMKGKGAADVAKDLNKAATKNGDLKAIMWAAYKPAEKAGIGVGPMGKGIEAKIISMQKKPLTDKELKDQTDDLIKIANVAKSMADIAELNTPLKDDGKKKVANWKKYNQTQRDAAKELEDATKGGKPDKVLDAIKNLYSSCTNCHGDFRGE